MERQRMPISHNHMSHCVSCHCWCQLIFLACQTSWSPTRLCLWSAGCQYFGNFKVFLAALIVCLRINEYKSCEKTKFYRSQILYNHMIQRKKKSVVYPWTMLADFGERIVFVSGVGMEKFRFAWSVRTWEEMFVLRKWDACLRPPIAFDAVF